MTPRQSECYKYMKLGLTAREIGVVMSIARCSAHKMRNAVNRQISITERNRLASKASRRYLSGLSDSLLKMI